MGTPQRQQPPDQARPAGSACVWVVAVLLLLAVLAGGSCLVLYLTLPPAEVPQWLPMAGLALVALPWAFWIATCAYRCCCSSDAAAAKGAAPPVARQPSSRKAAVAPMPSSKSLRGARSARHAAGDGASPASGSPTAGSGTRRVRFGDTTVLGEEKHAVAGDKDDDGSSVHSNESEAPLAYNMERSS